MTRVTSVASPSLAASVSLAAVGAAALAGAELDERSLVDLLSKLTERAAKGEFKPDEVSRVSDWFNSYIDGLVDDISAIDNIVSSAPTGELHGPTAAVLAAASEVAAQMEGYCG